MQLQHVVGIILLKCLKEALMERGQQMIVISRRGMGIVVPIARVLLPRDLAPTAFFHVSVVPEFPTTTNPQELKRRPGPRAQGILSGETPPSRCVTPVSSRRPSFAEPV